MAYLILSVRFLKVFLSKTLSLLYSSVNNWKINGQCTIFKGLKTWLGYFQSTNFLPTHNNMIPQQMFDKNSLWKAFYLSDVLLKVKFVKLECLDLTRHTILFHSHFIIWYFCFVLFL